MTEKDKQDLMADLFGGNAKKRSETSSGTKQEEIPTRKIFPSDKNCFRVEMDEAMEELIASIELNGILTPLIVRPLRDRGGYEILSGHRRCFAAKKAGLNMVPVIIMDVADEDRDIIIADSNLQRPTIRISEKAWAIRMKYEAMKRKAAADPGSQSSTQDVADKIGISDREVQRYVRLTHLIDALLELVDQKRIPLKAGVQLSYFSQTSQQYIFDAITEKNIKIGEEDVKRLRDNLSKDATKEEVFSFLFGKQKQKSKSESGLKINKKVRDRYFPKEYDDNQIQNVLLILLDRWAAENNPEYNAASDPGSPEK